MVGIRAASWPFLALPAADDGPRGIGERVERASTALVCNSRRGPDLNGGFE